VSLQGRVRAGDGVPTCCFTRTRNTSDWSRAPRPPQLAPISAPTSSPLSLPRSARASATPSINGFWPGAAPPEHPEPLARFVPSGDLRPCRTLKRQRNAIVAWRESVWRSP